ncbi:hypothetical protein [Alkalicoccus daliensis]|uniref:Uncharacterized protein n=1 Tax=Alkalicoccus daliensis TaxID=745820 RepID=A0A1H0ALL1_9BACI|nr:hypothetical protein [Alkalicoccus daliensis]SDN34289.1 hypothetical protein SAMN04488053_101535 [Alkalicoccus daliensis]
MQKIPSLKDDYADVEERLIHFIEMMSHADINSAWHHFAFLAEDRSSTFYEEGYLKKSRKFQVYYKDKLSYEGYLCWCYPHKKNGKWHAEISVRFDKIRKGNSLDLTEKYFQLDINLLDFLNESREELHIDVIELPESLSDYDQKRMNIILEKWGLQSRTVINFDKVDYSQLEVFVQHLISTAILVQAGYRREKVPYSKASLS